jgi:uncharacterized protein YcbX
VPRIARISIAPVRGLGLEHPEFVDLTETGVVEDRRFFLADRGGRLVDGLRAGMLVQIRSHTNPEGRTLRLEFPDGGVIEGEVELAEPVQAVVYNRIAVGHAVVGPWAGAISAFLGGPVTLVRCDRPGGTRTKNAVSLVSDGSLRELGAHAGVDDVDGRRFRMLFELEGATAHEEDGWIGTSIAVGGAVLSMTHPDARCAVTTQDPDTGEPDLDTLRTIIGYRGLREGKKIDFGVLGEVSVPGRVSVGDEVRVGEQIVDNSAVAELVSPA